MPLAMNLTQEVREKKIKHKTGLITNNKSSAGIIFYGWA